MNCKLVANHEICQGTTFQSYWCLYLADFMICHKFAIHCVCKLWTGMMISRFFQFLDILMPPGGQIQKSILVKWSTPIQFMICYKIAIHCVCKLWTGTRYYDFFPKSSIFRKQRWLPVRHFWSDDLFLGMLVSQVMLHIPAKYQTRNLYGYGDFPPDMSRSGISEFKMAASRPSWIGPTSKSIGFFLCESPLYISTFVKIDATVL